MAQRRSVSRTFRLPPEVDDAIRLAAQAAGESLTEFVARACLDRARSTWADKIGHAPSLDRAEAALGRRDEPRFAMPSVDVIDQHASAWHGQVDRTICARCDEVIVMGRFAVSRELTEHKADCRAHGSGTG